MKKACIFGVVMMFGAMSVLAKPSSKKTPAELIAEMDWIAGDWEGNHWGGVFHSYYCTPEGGKVISYSSLTKNGKKTYFEFELFEPDGDKVVFQPFPGGKRATPLTLTKSDPKARKVVFENPDKDYPTVIEYHRVSDDRLVITLSDPHNSSDKVDKFDLKRQ